jgi:hypothetical protein
MSATPTKYAAIRISEPTMPPAIAAPIIQSVSSVPITELARSAPRTKPKKPRTKRKTRYPAKQEINPPRSRMSAAGVWNAAGSIAADYMMTQCLKMARASLGRSPDLQPAS